MRHFGLLKGAAGGKCLIACTAKTAHAVRNIAQRHKFSLSILDVAELSDPTFAGLEMHTFSTTHAFRVFCNNARR